MERIIPDLNHFLLSPLTKAYIENDKVIKEEMTKDLYIKNIEEFERKCEKSLIETFSKLDIHAIVKTNPYSLPYNNEIVFILRGESYLNGPYEFFRVARTIVKEILIKNIYKLRFYLFINVITNISEQDKGFVRLVNSFGKVEYRFRYYV